MGYLLDLSDGTAAAPAVAWEDDSYRSGLYRIGANNIGASANSAKVWEWGTGGITLASGKTLTFGDGSTMTTAAGTSSTGDVTINADSDSSGAGDILFQTQGTTRGRVDVSGIYLIGTTVTTSASAGEVVLANAKALRGVNGAGTDTVDLIKADTNNYVVLGGLSNFPRVRQVTAASFPTADGSNNGLVGVDTTNNRLIFYVGGTRRYIIPDGTF